MFFVVVVPLALGRERRECRRDERTSDTFFFIFSSPSIEALFFFLLPACPPALSISPAREL